MSLSLKKTPPPHFAVALSSSALVKQGIFALIWSTVELMGSSFSLPPRMSTENGGQTGVTFNCACTAMLIIQAVRRIGFFIFKRLFKDGCIRRQVHCKILAKDQLSQSFSHSVDGNPRASTSVLSNRHALKI